MATPEKALADLVFITCKGMDKSQLKQELLESKRIDREYLLQMNKPLLTAIGQSYRAKSVKLLVDIVGII